MCVTWPGKLPTETDPLMTQSLRTDFPASVEASVVDGRPEVGDPGAIVWILLIIFCFVIAAGLIANWGRFFP